jgi:cytochrome P450
MSAITSFLSAICTRVLICLSGLAALFRLIGIGLPGSVGIGGSIQSRLTSPDALRTGFAFARAFLPTLALKTKFIIAYDNTGTVLVTRFDDVKDVLHRDCDFEAVYGPRMVQITAGQNFFLGMQDTPEYTRDVSNMRLAVRRDDLPVIVKSFAERRAAELVRACGGRIDVPQDLTLRVPAQLIGVYFGIREGDDRLDDDHVLVPVHRSCGRPGDRRGGARGGGEMPGLSRRGDPGTQSAPVRKGRYSQSLSSDAEERAAGNGRSWYPQ